MKIMTVIPAYNEEKSIARVITLIKSIDIDQQIDIVVVDDGSVDNTATEAEKTGATVIRLPVNLGIGGAVQTGYLYALHNNYDCVVQIDGDGQHDPKDLPKLLGLIEDGQADLAVGSRFVEKTGYRPPFFRKMGICYFSGLVELVTGLKINDTTSGYRAVNKNAIALFAQYYPEDYPEVETIAFAAKNGLIIKEISVDMCYREQGRSSITPLKSIYYAVKVTFSLLLSNKGGGDY